ncbi:MAG: DUF3990 domain-containing protein [Chitinispirillales bacterium]|nr:DUF3990 domain-containing protein [Chitinispirillales bacterium]
MELYHGSNQVVEYPKVLQQTHPMDFGGGFYTTTNYAQYVFKTQNLMNRLLFRESKNVQ